MDIRRAYMREQLSSDATKIAQLLTAPMTPKQYVVAIQQELECSGDYARNVLATADGQYVTFKEGLWRKRST